MPVSFVLASLSYPRMVTASLMELAMYDHDDPLAASRGVAWGLALSILIWATIYFCVGIFF